MINFITIKHICQIEKRIKLKHPSLHPNFIGLPLMECFAECFPNYGTMICQNTAANETEKLSKTFYS